MSAITCVRYDTVPGMVRCALPTDTARRVTSTSRDATWPPMSVPDIAQRTRSSIAFVRTERTHSGIAYVSVGHRLGGVADTSSPPLAVNPPAGPTSTTLGSPTYNGCSEGWSRLERAAKSKVKRAPRRYRLYGGEGFLCLIAECRGHGLIMSIGHGAR